MTNPTIIAFGDGDTGFYTNADDQITFAVGGRILPDTDWASVYIGVLGHGQPADIMYDIYRTAIEYEQAKARKIQ